MIKSKNKVLAKTIWNLAFLIKDVTLIKLIEEVVPIPNLILIVPFIVLLIRT